MSVYSRTYFKTIIFDYQDSFADSSLRDAVPLCDKKGNPIIRYGGQCAVSKLKCRDNRIAALRFWFQESSDNDKIYAQLSEYILNNPAPYLLKMKYIKKAVTFQGNVHPALLMDWCAGESLKCFIESNLHNKHILKELSKNIDCMFRDMNNRGISHGDIHHENIIIMKGCSPCLVDYDSFYVPQLRGTKDYCLGYSGYQLPNAREDNEYLSPKTDYFSQLIVMLTLECLIEEPWLWSRYMDDDEYSLLFKKKDFMALTESSIYQDIKNLGGNVTTLVNTLNLYLNETEIDNLWPYYERKSSSKQKIYSNYCINCGQSRYSIADQYCTRCGIRIYD